MRQLLVADIGGTNARFALAAPDTGVLSAADELRTADHASLEDAMDAYLANQPQRPQLCGASLAVASPVCGDDIRITNNPWAFSVSGLRRRLGLERVGVINDFAAISLSLPGLDQGALVPVGQWEPVRESLNGDRTYAALGPGTGLGVSGLAIREGRHTVLETEAGHISFAPEDEFEVEVWRLLQRLHGRVSVERIASGTGLIGVYRAVCTIHGVESTQLDAPGVAEAADAGDLNAVRSLQLFCQVLGGFAGDIALAFGAWDGVYLAGGVTLKLRRWIGDGGFRRRFEHKGRHAPILRKVPAWIITEPRVGLMGAAIAATHGRGG